MKEYLEQRIKLLEESVKFCEEKYLNEKNERIERIYEILLSQYSFAVSELKIILSIL